MHNNATQFGFKMILVMFRVVAFIFVVFNLVVSDTTNGATSSFSFNEAFFQSLFMFIAPMWVELLAAIDSNDWKRGASSTIRLVYNIAGSIGGLFVTAISLAGVFVPIQISQTILWFNVCVAAFCIAVFMLAIDFWEITERIIKKAFEKNQYRKSMNKLSKTTINS